VAAKRQTPKTSRQRRRSPNSSKEASGPTWEPVPEQSGEECAREFCEKNPLISIFREWRGQNLSLKEARGLLPKQVERWPVEFRNTLERCLIKHAGELDPLDSELRDEEREDMEKFLANHQPPPHETAWEGTRGRAPFSHIFLFQFWRSASEQVA